jgi:O-antigen ligase
LSLAVQGPFAADAGRDGGLADRFDWAASFVILLLMSGGLLAPLFSPDQNPDSVPWLRTMWLPTYGLVAALFLRDPLRASRVAVGAGLSLVLCAWAFVSMKWSIHPDVTLRRSIALLFTTVFGLHLAARYDWPDLTRMTAGAFALLAVGSAIAGLAFPAFGGDPAHPGAWRGLWYEKNQLGWLMTHGALACACAAIFDRRRRLAWIVAVGLCAGAVVMSKSTTSLLGTVCGLGGLFVLLLLRRGGWMTVATLWLALALGVGFLGVLTVAPDAFFELIGKDPSLTGRTDIWAAVLHRVELRPTLGYGFGAVWNDPWGPAWFIREEVQWRAPTAHNGWLDILLQLGGVGVALAALHFLLSAAAAVASIRRPESYWAIPFMALFAVFSISESTIMQYNGLTWVLYIAIMAKLFEWRGFAGGPAPRVGGVKLFPDP